MRASIHNQIGHSVHDRRAKQAGRGGHADKLLKAHSRDLGQRQQLACPQAASGLFAHQVRSGGRSFRAAFCMRNITDRIALPAHQATWH
ncbi:hypothetical protein WJX82_000738 [Trebouxia sp. C0006]